MSYSPTHFGNDNPLGRRFSFGGPQIEIIGVAKNARYTSLTTDIPPTVDIPYRQDLRGTGLATFALRTRRNPLTHVGAVRQIIQGIDRGVPLSEIRTRAAEVDRSIGQSVMFARLCTAFAVLALVIACVGLYASVVYRVERRTNEIGIRMALGAQRGRMIWLILRQVSLPVGLGLAVVVSIAYATSRFVKSSLFGLSANDPLTIAVAVGLLFACAIGAAYGPARRVSRIDPMIALRHE
jgi:predicted lysophospholipase L1 biosynthesis ABC-type transport system permease subunit